MRLSVCILTLLLGLAGAYLVGAGIFSDNSIVRSPWDELARPFAAAQPLASLVLALSVLAAFLSLAIAAGTAPGARSIQAGHVFLWGSLFSVLTAAGFAVLLYTLWRQGSGGSELGLIFALTSVQACLAVLLGGGAVVLERRLWPVTVPIFMIGLLETAGAGFVVAFGLSL